MRRQQDSYAEPEASRTVTKGTVVPFPETGDRDMSSMVERIRQGSEDAMEELYAVVRRTADPYFR